MEMARVAELRKQFNTINRSNMELRKPLIEDLMHSLETENPSHKELMEKEKPIIAELMEKLKRREIERELEHTNSMSDFGSTYSESTFSDSEYSAVSEAPSIERADSPPQDSFTREPPTKSPRRTRVKSPLEAILAREKSRQEFKQFVASKGASENIEFWLACHECERKTQSCATLAKKIIGKLMKEMKDTQGHPEKSHMDLALNSAVVAVRYELMLHKEETLENVRFIVNQYVRDDAPERVNLTTEKRNALIRAVDGTQGDKDDGSDALCALTHARREMRDFMEKKFYSEFVTTHPTS